MKFATPFLVLLSSTAALSSFVFRRDIEYDPGNEERIYNNASEACKKDIEAANQNECMFNIIALRTNYKELCPIYQSEKCKKFYMDTESLVPNCKDNAEVMAEFSNDLAEFGLTIINTYCQFDENDELCPLAKAALTKGQTTEDDLASSCYSKKCTENAKELINGIIENAEGINSNPSLSGEITSTDKYIDSENLKYLESEECTSQQTSDAETFKVGMTFLASLALLLLSFY